MKKILYIAALLAVAAGCSKELDYSAPAKGDLVPYTFQATLEQTKAEIADDGVFSWSAGDEIAVFDTKTSKFYTFTAAAADGSFSGTAPEGASFSVAYYPASVAGTAENEIVLPDTYSQADAAAGKLFPMVADATAPTLTFSHLGALLRLTVNDVPVNATSLVLSSDATIAGSFTPAEVSGKQVISAGGAASSVTVALSNDAKTDLTLTLPVPTGTFNYTLTLGDGTTDMLTKGTTSAKPIARASLHKMSALTVAYPTTDKVIIGEYTFNSQNAKWKTPYVPVSFETTDYYGWLKATGLGMLDKHIALKLYKEETDKYTGIVADQYQIEKTISSVAADEFGNNYVVYGNDSALDIYYNPVTNLIFSLPSGADFAIPTHNSLPCDNYSLTGAVSDIGWGGVLPLEVIEENDDWRVVKNVATQPEPNWGNHLIDFKFWKSGDWNITLGSMINEWLYSENLAVTGANNIIFRNKNNTQAVFDVYLYKDGTKVFALPAGSAFAIPTTHEHSRWFTLIGLFNNHNWDYDLDFSLVPGQLDWLVCEGVKLNDDRTDNFMNIKVRFKKSWGTPQIGREYEDPSPYLSLGNFYDTKENYYNGGGEPASVNLNVTSNDRLIDVYFKTDLSKIGVFEHGDKNVTFPE